jgi:hypothetical protein
MTILLLTESRRWQSSREFLRRLPAAQPADARHPCRELRPPIIQEPQSGGRHSLDIRLGIRPQNKAICVTGQPPASLHRFIRMRQLANSRDCRLPYVTTSCCCLMTLVSASCPLSSHNFRSYEQRQAGRLLMMRPRAAIRPRSGSARPVVFCRFSFLLSRVVQRPNRASVQLGSPPEALAGISARQVSVSRATVCPSAKRTKQTSTLRPPCQWRACPIRCAAERRPQVRIEAGRAPAEAFVPQSHRPGGEAEVDGHRRACLRPGRPGAAITEHRRAGPSSPGRPAPGTGAATGGRSSDRNAAGQGTDVRAGHAPVRRVTGGGGLRGRRARSWRSFRSGGRGRRTRATITL